jgi:CBS domain-containing protein
MARHISFVSILVGASMPQPEKREHDRLLAVRTVAVIIGRNRSITLSSVRCPLRARAAPVEECASCGRSDGIAHDALSRGEYLACSDDVPREPQPARTAAEACVAEVMRSSSVAVRPGVTRAVAADALRAHGAAAAPVVDGEGRPIGVVTEADLLRARTGARVSDAMARVALPVLETASLARTAALMAAERAERLPVVSADGVVVGMISAMDVVAWLAGAGGPLAPPDAAPGAQRS